MRWVVGGASDAPVDLFAAYAVPARGTTHVRSNFATSIDGAVEVSGVSRGVSSDTDREIFQVLRTLCDVVLVGAQTARSEQYGPARPAPERIAYRQAHGYADVPTIAVLTKTGQLDAASRLFTEARQKTVVLCPVDVIAADDPLRMVAQVVELGTSTVSPSAAIAALAERGMTRILCEGGPRLHHELVAAGVLDELCLTLSPLTAGPAHRFASEPFDDPARFDVAHALEHEGSIFLRLSRR